MHARHNVEQHLKRLRMPGMLLNLDVRLEQAREGTLGHLEFLSLLVQDEIQSREANNLRKRLRAAGFGMEKTFEGFNFRFNEDALPSSTVRDLASMHFVEQRRNLVLAGPAGIGKTHIAKAIGHDVCRRGVDVVFRKTHSLLGELLDRTSPLHAERLLNRCLKVELLILDDFAFRTLDHKEAELLYTLAEERGGRASTILTSNRPPQDWYAILPDPVMGGAILGRLVSAAVKLIVTKGRSYRREGPSEGPSLLTDPIGFE